MLVCKICGYKQYDEETIEIVKNKYPDMEEHDIPYYCGACQDNNDLLEDLAMEQKEQM